MEISGVYNHAKAKTVEYGQTAASILCTRTRSGVSGYCADGNSGSAHLYHTTPASGEGTAGTHYDQTDFGYDSTKQRNRGVSPRRHDHLPGLRRTSPRNGHLRRDRRQRCERS